MPLPCRSRWRCRASSTVTVGNEGLTWNELTGTLSVVATDDDDDGDDDDGDPAFELRPGDPVVLRYDDEGRILRTAGGRERRLPTLLSSGGRGRILHPRNGRLLRAAVRRAGQCPRRSSKRRCWCWWGHQAVPVPWRDEDGWREKGRPEQAGGRPGDVRAGSPRCRSASG